VAVVGAGYSQRHLLELERCFEVHVCGEGGEYESLVIDSPLYHKSISIEASSVVRTFGDVGHLRIEKASLVSKENPPPSNHLERVAMARATLAKHPTSRFAREPICDVSNDEVAASLAAAAATPPSKGTVPSAAAAAVVVKPELYPSFHPHCTGGEHSGDGDGSDTGQWLCVAGLVADGGAEVSAGDQAADIVAKLGEILAKRNFEPSDVMLVHL
jgi:hypothetical protein